eukprot:CAMPEP_0118922292 /NCGR_PEP_ID=MMETSP1169-20130426/1268_1 /TAXON_ID=36882 /ORGANISM="Pyramimonas obovata, Strain CCMP722" /LENGTH=70 /DNA_ID=CAMNT_0006863131 /DNA_START=158 /DNA_END=370 /DNA_ORIENTATION=+
MTPAAMQVEGRPSSRASIDSNGSSDSNAFAPGTSPVTSWMRNMTEKKPVVFRNCFTNEPAQPVDAQRATR